jgi:zinc protease
MHLVYHLLKIYLKYVFSAAVLLIYSPYIILADQKVTNFVLDNGLEVVVIEDHRAPVVVHSLWYKAGAADEEPGKSGVAHFLEHLLFKGTKKVDSGEFSETVRKLGGSDNAFTSWDYTGYYQRVSKDRLALMMELESDRMINNQFSEEEMEIERKVVLEERSQRTDSDPGALFAEQRQAAMYLNHPYGVPIIGWRHEIENLTRQDIKAFYKKYYAPNFATLIIAGDVYPLEVRNLAEEHYGSLTPAPGASKRHRNSEPPQLAERKIVFEDERVSQPYLIRTYLVPERNQGLQKVPAALNVLAELLGGNENTSVLGKALQLEEKKALYTSAFYSGVSYDATTFGLLVVPVKGRTLQQAEKDLDLAISNFIQKGVDLNQLDRIKRQLRASDIYIRDNIFGLARSYGSALMSGLNIGDIQSWPDLLQDVSPEEIIEVAKSLNNKKNAVTGFFKQPTDKKDR